MAWSYNKQERYARVFISYSRDDGEGFARDLRTRLEAESIPIWQDRVGMEGGRDWWQQITEALDKVEFMVLVMTPAAMVSETVRKEWRYARQQGVCVYPVKSAPDLDFNSLPHWMHSAHFYDLNQDWQKLVNDLNTHCQQPRVPFMVEDLPAVYVPRPQEFETLIEKLLDQQREEPIAITAALRGAGGYGKTTMAKALCHDERIQQAFDDGILWVTLGEHPGNLVGKVEDLIYMLSHERPGFTGIDTAGARLAELLADRDILLVVDDVWDVMHLKPFLHGGKRCARLVTTRNQDVLPANAPSLVVDAMQQAEAVQLLSFGLQPGVFTTTELQALRALVTRLGEWALLLKLANSVLFYRVGQRETFANALTYLNRALDRHGLTAFDAENPQARDAAVSATLRVSFDLLHPEQYARYLELAVFPQDVDIPLATLVKLWSSTGKLDDFDTEELCQTLYRYSLLLNFDLAMRTIRLHDVIRSYLQKAVGDTLPALHAGLLDAYSLERWADLPENEPYLWDHLAEHLVEAGKLEKLVATVRDGGYLASKTYFRSVYAIETDLDIVERQAPTDASLHLLRRNIARVSHLLNQCKTLQEVAGVLHSRLSPLSGLSDVCITLEQDLTRPFLTSWHEFLDLSHTALIRTLQGHKDWVRGCAITSAGDYIVSASYDKTLNVWDAHTGAKRLTLEGHISGVNRCTISPSGDFIVSASDDGTLKIWNMQSGTEHIALIGHTAEVFGCAVSPSGDWIVSASADATLKVWDSDTGAERLTLVGHTDGVYGCAISPAGDWIVSASADATLKIWDAHTGAERATPMSHKEGVYSCAVSPAGDWIVSASYDNTLKVWDMQMEAEYLTPSNSTAHVNGCAVSPVGDFIVSASDDMMLKVWDPLLGTERLTLKGHSDSVQACAVSPVGAWIVSASNDETLKVWDAQIGLEHLALIGHKSRVNACAISPAGDWIVSASDDMMLKVWDALLGTERLTLTGHADWVHGCAVSPAGDYIVSASFDKTLKVWDTRTRIERFTLRGHSDAVTACAVSPTGDWIVSASFDKTLKVWDAQTGNELITLKGHSSGVTACGVSPAGDWIVSTSIDQTLKVWNAQTGECLTTLLVDDKLRACAFCPDGTHLVSGGESNIFFLRIML